MQPELIDLIVTASLRTRPGTVTYLASVFIATFKSNFLLKILTLWVRVCSGLNECIV